LAEVLERGSDQDCDALLEHWRGAGELEKASQYAERGAHRAEDALAFKRAAYLYREAISLLPEGDERVHALQERLGHALVLTGRCSEAAAVFQALIRECHQEERALYAPYQFCYAVHGDSINTLTVPWYSGMAQGQMLTALCRLYEFTGQTEYLDMAQPVFESLKRLRGSTDKWVVFIDRDGYYWIEEYPVRNRPLMVLNGFNSAVFGVYEYYLATGDKNARRLLELCLTTLKRYLPHYLNGVTTSWYDLVCSVEAPAAYHVLHAEQMLDLYRMTGDRYFHDMAEEFAGRIPDSSGS